MKIRTWKNFGVLCVALLVLPTAVPADTLSDDIDLVNVGGTVGGVTFVGIDASDQAGYSVSAGDINGDGIDDLVISAIESDTNQTVPNGEVYLIYGQENTTTWVSPEDLDDVGAVSGIVGAVFLGEASGDQAGFSVSATGDVDGDGYDDILIGANGHGTNGEGRVYLIYGQASGVDELSGSLDLDEVTGGGQGDSIEGAIFDGVDNSDGAGNAVAIVADFGEDSNGDDDILIGARSANFGSKHSGAAYLIYGQTGLSGLKNLADVNDSGFAGVSFEGADHAGDTGYSVSSAGDFDGDGNGDILISAFENNGPNGLISGEVYLIYGGTGLSGDIEIERVKGNSWPTPSEEIAGITFQGAAQNDHAGTSVANAGDVNGDGKDDILISAPQADPGTSPRSNAGEVYLVYGNGTRIEEDKDLSTVGGSLAGAVFEGAATGDLVGTGSGEAVAGVGDLNGDGVDDILIGAHFATTDSENGNGEAYLIYGQTGTDELDTNYDLNDVGDGVNDLQGVRFTGDRNIDRAGFSVSAAGDFNDDGLDDLIISAHNARVSLTDSTRPGKAYIVFGGCPDPDFGAGSVQLVDVGSTAGGATFMGTKKDDRAGSWVSHGDVNGDGYDDLLISAPWTDPGDPAKDGAGEVYLIYGQGSGNVFSGDYDLDKVGATGAGAIAGAVFKADQADAGDHPGDPSSNWNSGSQAGFTALDATGDFDGDGINDILIGVPTQDVGSPVAENAGVVYVIYGISGVNQHSGSIDLADVDEVGGPDGAIFEGSQGDGSTEFAYGERAGRSVAFVGDVNKDGVDDILIGARAYDDTSENEGAAYLVYGIKEGGQTSRLEGTYALSLVGSTGAEGARFVGVDSDGAYNTGHSVAGAGDVNGDDVDDLLIGAPRHKVTSNDRHGAAYLIYGIDDTDFTDKLNGTIDLGNIPAGVDWARFEGDNTVDIAGYSVAGAGDVDNDGNDDILIGAPAADAGSITDAGKVYLIYGISGVSQHEDAIDLGTVSAGVFQGVAEGDWAGEVVAGAGDVNNDGYDDILIGAERVGCNIGAAYLIYGKDSAFSTAIDLDDVGTGTAGLAFVGGPKDRAGTSVSAAGDVNGDGVDDLLIGADQHINNEAELWPESIYSKPGRAYLIYGQGTVDFAAPFFTTFDDTGNVMDTIVRIHNNDSTEAKIRFQFVPVQEIDGTSADAIVYNRDNVISVPAGEAVRVDLESAATGDDTDVDPDMVGAYTMTVEGASANAISVDEFIVRNPATEEGMYVPVKQPHVQSVGTVFSTQDNDAVHPAEPVQIFDTAISLFNHDVLPIKVKVNFYEENDATVYATYTVTVQPKSLERFRVGEEEDLPSGTGTWSGDWNLEEERVDHIGFFRIVKHVDDSDPPATLTSAAHIMMNGNADDRFFIEIVDPDSSDAELFSPIFEVKKAGTVIENDTFIALVNTGTADVTASFSFSTGATTGSISNVTLEPNKMQNFFFGDSIDPGTGGTNSGGFKISLSGSGDLSKVAVHAHVATGLNGSDPDHVRSPVREKFIPTVSTTFETTNPTDTYLYLYNTGSNSVDVTVTLHEDGTTSTDSDPVITVGPNTFKAVILSLTLDNTNGWVTLSYSAAEPVIASLVADIGDFYFIDAYKPD